MPVGILGNLMKEAVALVAPLASSGGIGTTMSLVDDYQLRALQGEVLCSTRSLDEVR